jgi:hypothetical protein
MVDIREGKGKEETNSWPEKKIIWFFFFVLSQNWGPVSILEVANGKESVRGRFNCWPFQTTVAQCHAPLPFRVTNHCSLALTLIFNNQWCSVVSTKQQRGRRFEHSWWSRSCFLVHTDSLLFKLINIYKKPAYKISISCISLFLYMFLKRKKNKLKENMELTKK